MSDIEFKRYDLPIHYREEIIQKAGWYFYDETWGNAHGPYETKEEAQKSLNEYIKYLNGEDNE